MSSAPVQITAWGGFMGPSGGFLIAVINMMVGFFLIIIGPVGYQIMYTSYYYNRYLQAMVASRGAFCILTGISLICGIKYGKKYTIRYSILLYFATSLLIFTAGILCFNVSLNSGWGVLQLLVSFWLFSSVGILITIGNDLVVPPATRVGNPSSAPEPSAAVQQRFENMYVNETSMFPNSQIQSQAPSTQPLPSLHPSVIYRYPPTQPPYNQNVPHNAPYFTMGPPSQPQQCQNCASFSPRRVSTISSKDISSAQNSRHRNNAQTVGGATSSSPQNFISQGDTNPVHRIASPEHSASRRYASNKSEIPSVSTASANSGLKFPPQDPETYQVTQRRLSV